MGDVRLHLDRKIRPLQPLATITDIADPEQVSGLILEQVDRVRRLTNETIEHAGVRTEANEEPVPAAAPMPLVQELRELAALHDAGALTDDEFQRLKARLIDP